MDQARGRGRGRHDGSHRLRRDALRSDIHPVRGSRKRAPYFFRVQVILLGTAAGGGFPQWNCWCPSCRVARRDPERARPRRQSSAAVSADGRRWFLLERVARRARPAGLARRPRSRPACGTSRSRGSCSPTRSWITRSGLVLLREAGYLPVYATPAVQQHPRARLAHPSGDAGVRRGEAHGAADRQRERRSATATAVPAA